jgi:uncharacterized membrane protein YsdA (DUF1294 family)
MQPDYLTHILTLYLLINVAVFCVYWRDKRAAKLGERRIREKTLLLLAFGGGGAGAFAAQRLLHHKTRKPPFRLALPFFFVVQTILLVMVLADSAGAALP